MIISKVKLNNFRSYKGEHSIEFEKLTAFVGKNDIGKSTILEALDIFFNDGKGCIKFDKNDINKEAQNNGTNETAISVCFKELPDEIIIDDTVTTSLRSEYLLNINGELEIIKKYSGEKPKIFIKAHHPTNANCNNLLNTAQSNLQKIISYNAI